MSSPTTIDASVTFLSAEEGGRSHPALNNPRYRPHLVVGDPTQRIALLADDQRTLTEDYLGVWFCGDGGALLPGRSYNVTLRLLYYPHPAYDALVTDVTFTIREGAKVVGFGRVIKGVESAVA
jgi:hypothetical protein